MRTVELEFRGINHQHLGLYFEELGGKRVTDAFPFMYVAEEWQGQIVNEEEISITSTFKVNRVFIRFQAENEEILNQLVTNYRVKTRRIGG